MAALDKSTIPSNINSYERLLVWAAQCCQSIANGEEIIAVQGEAQVPLAQVQIAKTADNVDRFIIVVYAPVDYNELNSGTEKTWMAALDISQAQPNTNLLSN